MIIIMKLTEIPRLLFQIYPSEFGLQRMKIEEVKGPTELTEKPLTNITDQDDEDEEGINNNYTLAFLFKEISPSFYSIDENISEMICYISNNLQIVHF